MRTINEKYGYWLVDELKFENKYDALGAAALYNKTPEWIFHNPTWDNFDRTKLGATPIKTLYKERAQQLRDTYDYLILYYSGGSDSHTVLRTFLDNNIKLDEICVKWPKIYQDGKFYVPNCVNLGPENHWSEWDFCVKPVLNILKSTHPEIYINVIDYYEGVNNLKMESVFEKSRHMRTASGMIFNSARSDTELKKSDSVRISHIYGVEKPILSLKNNQFNMHFSEFSLSVFPKTNDESTNIECFFWSENMPILAYEQAYQAAEYYIKNPGARKYLWGSTKVSRQMIQKFQADVAIKVLYDTWDYRFQADKPAYRFVSDKPEIVRPTHNDPYAANALKWQWFSKSIETAHLEKAYVGLRNDQLSAIDHNYQKSKETIHTINGVTKGFFVRNLTDESI
jgi:hypothetical protein